MLQFLFANTRGENRNIHLWNGKSGRETFLRLMPKTHNIVHQRKKKAKSTKNDTFDLFQKKLGMAEKDHPKR